jgi:hypothetical protein
MNFISLLKYLILILIFSSTLTIAEEPTEEGFREVFLPVELHLEFDAGKLRGILQLVNNAEQAISLSKTVLETPAFQIYENFYPSETKIASQYVTHKFGKGEPEYIYLKPTDKMISNVSITDNYRLKEEQVYIIFFMAGAASLDNTSTYVTSNKIKFKIVNGVIVSSPYGFSNK